MLHSTPRVSIGIPVYNGADYLREALDSLLAQTYTDFELVISDNGSTDDTQRICEEYAARDPRIRYHRSDVNHGASWNFNRVVALSVGEFFRWAAHDDTCAPTYLERCVEVFDRHPNAALVQTRTTMIDESSQPIVNYSGDTLHLTAARPSERYKGYHARFRRHGNANAAFGLVRARFLAHTSLLARYVSSDYVYLAELAMLGEVHEVPEYLFMRRDHPQRSVRANPDHDNRIAWFDPKKRGSIQFPRWRLFYEYLRAITQIPMPWSERVPCYGETLRWFVWRRRDMLDDLKFAARQVARLALPAR